MIPRTLRHDLPIHFVLGILAILTFFPFVFLLVSSFRTTAEFTHQFWGIPWNPELLNYVDAWTVISPYMLNSLIVSAVSTIGVLGIASLSAFVFARFNFLGAKPFYGNSGSIDGAKRLDACTCVSARQRFGID